LIYVDWWVSLDENGITVGALRELKKLGNLRELSIGWEWGNI
jgi:hypothetical protein